MIPKILNRLGICSVLDLSKAAIFLVRKSVFSENTLAIVTNLFPGEQWNPSDLYKIDMPVALVEKQKAKAIKQANTLLQREGLTTSTR